MERSPNNRVPTACPFCDGELILISNSDLHGQLEWIPICQKCKKAYRYPELGWKRATPPGQNGGTQ